MDGTGISIESSEDSLIWVSRSRIRHLNLGPPKDEAVLWQRLVKRIKRKWRNTNELRNQQIDDAPMNQHANVNRKRTPRWDCRERHCRHVASTAIKAAVRPVDFKCPRHGAQTGSSGAPCCGDGPPWDSQQEVP